MTLPRFAWKYSHSAVSSGWFLSPRPGWIRFGEIEVDVLDMELEDIACAIEQLTAERCQP